LAVTFESPGIARGAMRADRRARRLDDAIAKVGGSPRRDAQASNR
jgi:hypothetical protein